MPREKKVPIIDSLQEVISTCSVGILTDYRGLSTAELTALRNKLRESGIHFKVVKNTLARIAAKRAGKAALANYLEGPIAIAFSYGDIVGPARTLIDYIRTSKTSLDIKGGFVHDTLLAPKEVTTLSTLPPREVLLAKVLGGMQSPIITLASCLANPIRGIIGILQARIQQLEGE